jgi:hypothetical protein
MNSGRKSQQKSASRRIALHRGWLKNGNPSGDFLKAPRCGARNRQGKPCQCPAMRGKRRCRLHGGKSTGAKTKAGVQRIRAAHWKHGCRSARLQAEARVKDRREEQEILKALTRNDDDLTIYVRSLLGMPAFPRVKVRVHGIRRGGPPPEWAKEPDETK